jgi:RNA 3'-terminal phosphate cyclase (ATP)
MKAVDGSDGGGQVLRLAVSLSALTGRAVRVENVRGGRETPGLRPQHVAAVETVAAVTDAETDGVSQGSETVVFEPRARLGGTHGVAVGTAGSVTLLFDAVLPLALGADEPITVAAAGGTDVKWSPTIDYVRSVKLPLLRSKGLNASVTVERRGFYPAGGGRATLTIEPSTVEPLRFPTRGSLETVAVHSVATADLAGADVAQRQVTGVTDVLEAAVDAPIAAETASVDAPSTGTAVLVAPQYERLTAGFTALGEPGRPAEAVGEAAAERFLEFHDSDAAVDPHLADQLLPFLASAGGAYTTPAPTDHLRTAIPVLQQFGGEVAMETGTPTRLTAPITRDGGLGPR